MKLKNNNLIFLTAFINGIHTYMMRVLIQPFVLSITSSMTMVGLVDGLTHSLVPSLIQLPSGFVSDRVGRKTPIIVASILIIFSFLVFLSAYFTGSIALVILGAVLFGLGTLGAPARDSMVAESADASKRIMLYNLVAFAMVVPGIFTSFLGGKIADIRGYNAVFVISVFLEIACLILYLFLRESMTNKENDIFNRKHMNIFLKNVFNVPRALLVFYLIIAVDSFVWGLGYRILFGLLRREYSLSLTQIGILGSVSVFSWAVLQIPIGLFMNKFGCKKALILSEVFGGVGLLGIILFKNFGLLVVFQVFLGLIPAFWLPAIRILVANSVSENQRAESLGRLTLFTGVTGFLGSFAGGVIYEMSGLILPVLLNVIGAAIMVFTILFFIKESKDKSLMEVEPEYKVP
ncbi:MAG: hypothetical protein A2452_12295 [Candidatus Firestonebacteria bacterium RIFOXYC2_FULL_39_67]|nr:MAG: hypothetical protein A2536_07825 [Candidatus Firestonebacteria bacterium RIFOXYD2_FULL_39_29]OGF55628.1 MAG: hypothetical protein A2452_12295 [Candidatus Firestonebacteria bacterium RIFOXYC2_FULL_39_67]OGF57705.1 MAG: hypothetical protein A2497_05065 [Candidatus Firestonebacteria bacterium RifOxyC12_full_39_7]